MFWKSINRDPESSGVSRWSSSGLSRSSSFHQVSVTGVLLSLVAEQSNLAYVLFSSIVTSDGAPTNLVGSAKDSAQN